jgi:hypothetical protein
VVQKEVITHDVPEKGPFSRRNELAAHRIETTAVSSRDWTEFCNK